DEIQRELRARLVFVVILSKSAFASAWVRDECQWAYNLYKREPSRIILPVTASPLDPGDFDNMLFLEGFKRLEGASGRPYPKAEAVEHALHLLALTPRGQPLVPTTRQLVESADDLIARGKALDAQEQYPQALVLFEQATELAPSNADAWFNLGYVRNALGL